jgi:hypothetical protein
MCVVTIFKLPADYTNYTVKIQVYQEKSRILFFEKKNLIWLRSVFVG